SVADAIVAARALRPDGAAIVVATGVPDADDAIATVAVQARFAHVVTTPRIAIRVHGTGDSFAAILLGRLLAGDAIEAALAFATSAISALLQETAARGARELELVAAQARIVDPAPRFAARAVA
ncbi:MAG: pyridoxal kinase, partial [Alphaproteobacteria bacterium]|nr:pyridoxal kinase [Alphaproteobacteria bacterium]